MHFRQTKLQRVRGHPRYIVAMTELPKLPKRLARPTIYEAVFEMRFSNRQPRSSSILPGLLYSKLGGLFPNSEELPLASMPPEFRGQNELLAYQPTHALSGERKRLMVGQRSMGVSLVRPYPGWAEFKDLVLMCAGALLATPFVDEVERCSLKYTNLLSEGRDVNDLSQLKVAIELNGFKLSAPGTALKAEIPHKGCLSIVQIFAGATVKLPGVTSATGDSGVMVDVDTIRTGPFSNAAADLSESLELVHTTEKEIFFSLLTDDTLNRLGPEW